MIYKVVTVCLLVLAGLAVGGYRRVARNHRVTQTFFILFILAPSLINFLIKFLGRDKIDALFWQTLESSIFKQVKLAPSITDNFISNKIITNICSLFWKNNCFSYLSLNSVFFFNFRSLFKSRKKPFFNLMARLKKWERYFLVVNWPCQSRKILNFFTQHLV